MVRGLFLTVGFWLTFASVAIALQLPLLVAWPVLHFADRRRVVARYARVLYCRCVLRLWLRRLAVEGAENLPGRDEVCVVVSNHRSNLDPMLLLLLGIPACFLSKKSARLVPFVGWWMLFTNDVAIDRSDRDSRAKGFRDMHERIKARIPICIFPEGTRRKMQDCLLAAFRDGAFRLAIEAGVKVLPVAIAGTDAVMRNQASLLQPARVRVRVLPALSAVGESVESLRERVWQVLAENLRSLDGVTGCEAS